MKVREQGKLCSVQKRRIADRTVVSCPERGIGERRPGWSLRKTGRPALPRTLRATGMTKAACRRREYPTRWRDRVQRRGIGDRERHESAVTAVYRAGLDDRGFERSEKPVPIPEGTRKALLEMAAGARRRRRLPH